MALLECRTQNGITTLTNTVSRITVECKNKVKYLAMTLDVKINGRSTKISIMKCLKYVTENFTICLAESQISPLKSNYTVIVKL